MKTPIELQRLADQIGQFIEYWGFKKIHGKIWTYLYLSDVPLCTAELIERLEVSKGLMSICMNELIGYGVIQETSKGRNGTLFYRANPDVGQVIINVLRVREKRMLVEIEHAFRTLKNLGDGETRASKLAPQSVESLGEMIEVAQSALNSLVPAGNDSGADLFNRFKVLSALKAAP